MRTRMMIMTMAIFNFPCLKVYGPRLPTTKITTMATKRTARTSTQLLTEYYSSFAKDEDEGGDESFVEIPTPDASLLSSKPRSRHKKKERSRSGDCFGGGWSI
jgi:hypothetical protein